MCCRDANRGIRAIEHRRPVAYVAATSPNTLPEARVGDSSRRTADDETELDVESDVWIDGSAPGRCARRVGLRLLEEQDARPVALDRLAEHELRSIAHVQEDKALRGRDAQAGDEQAVL